jgi:hypothetical protein
MNIYIIIGYDSKKEIEYDNNDALAIDKVYCVGNVEVEENELFKSVTDKNILTFYNDMNLENSEDKVVFIDCRINKSTYLDVMYSLNTCKFENRSYYVCKDKTIRLKNYPYINNFDPWTGETLPVNLTKVERENIMSMFLDAVNIFISYLKADFHVKKISSVPDGWMLNLSTPILHHITTYYNLKPHAKDVAKNVDYVHNSQYRQIVTEALIKVTSTFLIKNKIIDFGVKRDWFNVETWENFKF